MYYNCAEVRDENAYQLRWEKFGSFFFWLALVNFPFNLIFSFQITSVSKQIRYCVVLQDLNDSNFLELRPETATADQEKENDVPLAV